MGFPSAPAIQKDIITEILSAAGTIGRQLQLFHNSNRPSMTVSLEFHEEHSKCLLNDFSALESEVYSLVRQSNRLGNSVSIQNNILPNSRFVGVFGRGTFLATLGQPERRR